MAESPHDVFCGLDSKNAFGTPKRQAAVAEAARSCPEALPLTQATWKGTNPFFFLEQSDGTFSKHEVTEAMVQGGCDAQPAFCLALHNALTHFDNAEAAKKFKWS